MWHALTIAINPLSAGILQMFPAGVFRPSDGRKTGPWRMDKERATALIAWFKSRGQPLAIDYEHQSLYVEKNGQPAPAAGWMTGLEWREGEGLFAVVDWTERAAAAIKAGEYRYFSPVFASSGDRITGLGPGGITNNPALLGMAPLHAASAHHALSMEAPMEELIQKIRQALGLAPDASPEDVSAAFEKHLAEVAKLRESAGAMNAASVPLATFEALKSQFVALNSRIEAADLNALVAAGLADGRILPMQEGWARGLGVTALSAYLKVAVPMPQRGQSREIKQPNGGTVSLTDVEMQVCSQLGLSHEAFVAARDAA